MFRAIFLTVRDAQNRPNKCNLYAKGFPIDMYQNSLHPVSFMNLANVPSLQMWPELDTVSQWNMPAH